MKGVHLKRQTRYLNDLDSAIDRLMVTYFRTSKTISDSSNWTTQELLDDLTIEINNALHIAALASGSLTSSTEDLVRMLVVKTTHNILDALSDLFASTSVEDTSNGTVFTLWTDRTQVLNNQDRAFFLMTLRNNSLLSSCNVKLTIMDGAAKVLAA